MPSAIRLLLVVAMTAALGLGGCGRKGKLEPPPEQQLVKTPGGKTIDPGPERPKRGFILDPLLN